MALMIHYNNVKSRTVRVYLSLSKYGLEVRGSWMFQSTCLSSDCMLNPPMRPTCHLWKAVGKAHTNRQGKEI